MLASGITLTQIESAHSDDELLGIITRELARLSELHPYSTTDGYYEFIKSLPPGLRSMASVYELDVSMALDDLAWHFMNWHSFDLAQETLNGLLDLGAVREAEIFRQAIEVAIRHWDFIGSDDFREHNLGSRVDVEMDPLNRTFVEMMPSDVTGARTLLSYWAPYARTHPQRICHVQ